MISLQVAIHHPPTGADAGMRNRKKARTRLAIQDAALDLVAEHGYDATTVEAIVQRADVSASTFFRYFGSKADIVLHDHDVQLPELCTAIRGQSSDIRDLEAVRRALQAAWVPNIDALRTIRTVRAVAQSAFLRGMAYDVGVGWMEAVAATLVDRRADPDALPECLLIARTALGVFGAAAEHWGSSGAQEDFGALIDQGFAMIERICR
jgi:AcrR family transcriptional regulator